MVRTCARCVAHVLADYEGRFTPGMLTECRSKDTVFANNRQPSAWPLKFRISAQCVT